MIRRGFTLIELVATLVVVSVAAAAAALSFRAASPPAPSAEMLLDSARRRAIKTGHVVQGQLDSGRRYAAHPSGILIVDGLPGLLEARNDAR